MSASATVRVRDAGRNSTRSLRDLCRIMLADSGLPNQSGCWVGGWLSARQAKPTNSSKISRICRGHRPRPLPPHPTASTNLPPHPPPPLFRPLPTSLSFFLCFLGSTPPGTLALPPSSRTFPVSRLRFPPSFRVFPFLPRAAVRMGLRLPSNRPELLAFSLRLILLPAVPPTFITLPTLGATTAGNQPN